MITEADEKLIGLPREQAQARAISILRSIANQYFRNRETLGVLSMYERAANAAGCTWREIQSALNAEKELANSPK